MITERVIIPLLPGVDLEQEIQKLAAISTRQEGLLDAYWGLQAESEEMLEILTFWESAESNAFFYSNEPDFSETADIMRRMAACRPSLSRVRFDSPTASTSSISLSPLCVPSAVLKAPVVEMITFSALEEGSGSGPGSLADALGELARKMRGCLGVASGSVLEYDSGSFGWGGMGMGGGNSVVMAVGWSSMIASGRVEQSDGFAAKVEKHHVRFRSL